MTRHARAAAWWALAGSLLGASPAGAETPPSRPVEPGAVDEPPAPPVDTLVALALSRAPEVAAERAREAASRELVRPAGALADPMLVLSYRDADFPDYTVGEEEMSMIEVELDQPLPFPGKRGARRRAAEAEAGVTAAALRTVERRITREVRTLYARLYALDRTRVALRSARALLRLLEASTAARYAAGTSEMEAQLKAQLAVSRLEERLEDLAAERRAVQAEINRYLDQPAEQALGSVDSLPGFATPPADWRERAVAHAPSVLVARARVTAAESHLGVEKSERRPDLAFGAGYGYRGDLDPIVTFRVGAELPIWRSGRAGPRVRAAEAELVSARHVLRRAEAETRTEAERAVADWERSETQVRRYREAILPQSRTALEAARTSYEAGKGDFSTVVEDFNLWLEAQEQLASRVASRYAAWSRLEELAAPPQAATGGAGEGSR